MSGAELVRVLERLGYVQVGQSGSHVKLRRSFTVCVVPLHRELKRGTLAGVLAQANVTRDEFLNAVSQ